jgi:type IV pilus assembly protein PilB
LRQDPDAILVGEIRDQETAEISVQSALTGHLVLSSLHATDAVRAIYRFLEMGIEPFMVASSISGVVAQRLVRRICDQCVVEAEPTAEELEFYRQLGGYRRNFWKGAGCAHCSHTGFHDRIGLFEVIRVTDGFKRLLVKEEPPDVLRRQAIADGMTTLRQSGLAKIDEGQTTIGEVMRSVHVDVGM